MIFDKLLSYLPNGLAQFVVPVQSAAASTNITVPGLDPSDRLVAVHQVAFAGTYGSSMTCTVTDLTATTTITGGTQGSNNTTIASAGTTANNLILVTFAKKRIGF